MNHRRTRQSKRKTILGLIIAVVAVIIFGAVMYAVDVHSRQSEGKGDSGKWTAGLSDEERPVVYMCGNSSYLTTAPKDIQAVAQDHPERFRGARSLGWKLVIISLFAMVGAFVYAGWDGL